MLGYLKPMKTIAYLVYGDAVEYHLELTFSVASIIRFLNEEQSDIRIVIITDKEGCRPDLPVEYIVYSHQEFQNWTNFGKYNHSAKLHAAIKALEKSDGPVLLIDTDTYFIDHPKKAFEKISCGNTVMHEDEGKIGIMQDWQPLLMKAPPCILDYSINKDSFMYNSGAIGVSLDDIPLLNDAIIIADYLYAIQPLFNIEQFSLTAVLHKRTNVSFVNSIIEHYWPAHKRIFSHILIKNAVPEFTKENFNLLVENTISVQMPKIRNIDKIVTSLFAYFLKWDGNYKFAYLCYRSMKSEKNHAIKQGWYKVSKIFLSKSNYNDDRIKKNFKNLNKFTYY